MYIIAIGWLYVTLLMALTEGSVVAGVLSFTFYGLAPTFLLWWLLGTTARRRRRAQQETAERQAAIPVDDAPTDPPTLPKP